MPERVFGEKPESESGREPETKKSPIPLYEADAERSHKRNADPRANLKGS